MSELYNYIEDTGIVIPDTADIKTAVEAEFKAALGQQMSTNPDSPQGRLISAEVSARRAVVINNATLANQINPNFATGIFLDGVCALLGITRNSSEKSVIPSVTLRGIPLTEIRAGSRARSSTGDIFVSANTVLLNSAGIATVDFIADVAGGVSCASGALITVIDAVLGWETVFNDYAAVVGSGEQSDVALRSERKLRLANQGISTVEAQISGLYGLAGVHSLSFLENISHNFETIDGIYMKPHSVWACVHGGVDQDIARSLLQNKTDGAAWNGAISVTVIEPNADIPYIVLFDRPAEIPITVKVIMRSAQGTMDPNVVIPNALIAYAIGNLDGERGFVTGVDVSPFELAGAISLVHPGFFVQQVLISRSGEALASNEITIMKNEVATLSEENISVVINV